MYVLFHRPPLNSTEWDPYNNYNSYYNAYNFLIVGCIFERRLLLQLTTVDGPVFHGS